MENQSQPSGAMSVEVLSPEPMETLEADEFSNNPSKGNKRTKQQKEQDLIQIAIWTAKRMTQLEMAEKLSSMRPYTLSRSQIRLDQVELEKRLKEKHLKSLLINKSLTLEFIENIEREALNAWEASKMDFIKMRSETGAAGVQGADMSAAARKVTQERTKREGEPAYLALIIRLIELRIKILGLEAPVKTELDITANLKDGNQISRMREAYEKRIEHRVRQELVKQHPQLAPILNTP